MKLAKAVCACAILLITVVPVAQAEEERVWYCAPVASGGLRLTDGAWATQTFDAEKVIVKQIGNRLIFPDSYRNARFEDALCDPHGSEIFCHARYPPNETFRLSPEVGIATASAALGIEGEDMYVSIFNCETF